MEIHGPDKAVHSWKDFGIHIAIVTIGILIALSLEGVRETVHEHRLVRDARDTFRVELQMDQKHAGLELEAVVKATAQLKKLNSLSRRHRQEQLSSLPKLALLRASLHCADRRANRLIRLHEFSLLLL